MYVHNYIYREIYIYTCIIFVFFRTARRMPAQSLYLAIYQGKGMRLGVDLPGHPRSDGYIAASELCSHACCCMYRCAISLKVWYLWWHSFLSDGTRNFGEERSERLARASSASTIEIEIERARLPPGGRRATSSLADTPSFSFFLYLELEGSASLLDWRFFTWLDSHAYIRVYSGLSVFLWASCRSLTAWLIGDGRPGWWGFVWRFWTLLHCNICIVGYKLNGTSLGPKMKLNIAGEGSL